MIKKEITLFSFDELTNTVKEGLIKARAEKLQEQYAEWFLSDDIQNECGFLLKGDYGFVLPKDFNIYYSLSYSQGDGVAFIGKLFKRDASQIDFKNAYYIIFNNDSRYTHSHSFSIEAFDENGDEIEDTEYLYRQFRSISEKLEGIGYSYLERDFLDEAEEDLLNQDELVYLSNGKVWIETV